MTVVLEALVGGLIGSAAGTFITFHILEWRASEKVGEYERVIDNSTHKAG